MNTVLRGEFIKRIYESHPVPPKAGNRLDRLTFCVHGQFHYSQPLNFPLAAEAGVPARLRVRLYHAQRQDMFLRYNNEIAFSNAQ
jgi:hypothetical protein